MGPVPAATSNDCGAHFFLINLLKLLPFSAPTQENLLEGETIEQTEKKGTPFYGVTGEYPTRCAPARIPARQDRMPVKQGKAWRLVLDVAGKRRNAEQHTKQARHFTRCKECDNHKDPIEAIVYDAAQFFEAVLIDSIRLALDSRRDFCSHTYGKVFGAINRRRQLQFHGLAGLREGSGFARFEVVRPRPPSRPQRGTDSTTNKTPIKTRPPSSESNCFLQEMSVLIQIYSHSNICNKIRSHRPGRGARPAGRHPRPEAARPEKSGRPGSHHLR